MKNILRAMRYLPNYKRRISIALGLGLITSLIVSAIPLAIQSVIDTLFRSVENGNLAIDLVLAPILIWLALRFTLIVFEWWGEIVEDNLHKETFVDFRKVILDKVQRLSMTYFEKKRAGEITSVINQSPGRLSEWLSSAGTEYLALVFNAIIALAILTYKFPPIAIVVLVIACLYSWFTFHTMASNRRYWKINRKAVNEYGGAQTENISFVAHIRSLGVEKTRNNVLLNILGDHHKNLTTMYTYQHRRNFIASILDLLLYALPITIFAYRALQGQQQPTDIYLLSVYLGRISDVSSRLARMWTNTSETNEIIGDTLELLGNEDSVTDPLSPKELKEIKSITFQGVSFMYEGLKNNTIKDFSLDIEQGQTVALVGKSGAGKSTIVKLLLRFYDPVSGSIELNGTNLKDLAQDSYRSRFGVVMQDVALFNDTIANNIAIARPDASSKEITQAAKRAYADEFIKSFPDGYDTIVGERGVKLSGGEKQRISIARAILRKPEVVLLDEATSALDGESEKYVQKGLKQLLGGKTAIIIAHRLSTITHADKVVVLDKGKIVEQGTYEELKNAGGVFAELLAHQQL